MAKPLQPIIHSDEKERERLEDERNKKLKEFGELLTKAQEVLSIQNLEELIEREIIREKLLEERGNQHYGFKTIALTTFTSLVNQHTAIQIYGKLSTF